jgi:flagellar basal body-associated protein FliL
MSALATRQRSRPQAPPPRRKATSGSPSVQVLVLVLLILLCVALAGIAWYRVAHTLQTAKPVKVPTIHPVTGIIWAGRVFNTKQEMANWLHDRGASYVRWEQHNPDLARVLETR